jgi:NitT/TauT family transport system ATP-binding protein
MLKQSENGEMQDEIILGELALHFPHERPQRILRTVVAWARYAELFKYSSTRKVLYGMNPGSGATEPRIG